MKPSDSSRLAAIVAVGCTWNCWCLVQYIPQYLIARDVYSMISKVEQESAGLWQLDGVAEQTLGKFGIHQGGTSFPIVMRIAFLGVYCWAASRTVSARWGVIAGVVLLLNCLWQWGGDWWVWTIDLLLLTGLTWAVWLTGRTKAVRERQFSRPRVKYIQTNPAELA
jgi:hypothetical protein